MIRYHASWIVPIAGPPIRDGWIAVDGGRIAGVGPQRDSGGVRPTDGAQGRPERAEGRLQPDFPSHDLGAVAILPALVNAHTHLELSFLHDAVPPSDTFNDWVTAMMARRRQAALAPDSAPVVDAVVRAIDQARRSGTGLFGDISNTLATVPVLRQQAMPALVFHELVGFNLQDIAGRMRTARAAVAAANGDAADDVRVTTAPHAPYSVSPELFRAIRADVDAHDPPITTVHVGESAPELELLRSGTGVVRTMLERLGAWSETWHPPGSSPLSYLADLGFIDARTLVVHGVQFDAADLQRLARIGATLVSCPRSNVYVGVGSPPLAEFYAHGVNVAFGTDSLASVSDLNLFAELAEARRIAPTVPAAALLASATREGARALGFGTEFGTLEAGKRARLVAVSIPPHVGDVEEYLLTGIQPAQVSWLPA